MLTQIRNVLAAKHRTVKVLKVPMLL